VRFELRKGWFGVSISIAGFEAFGAQEKQILAVRARDIWKTDRERLSKVKTQGTIDAFMKSYKGDPYRQLDDAWSNLGDEETDAYIREHPSEFCIP
jgi:hypothetical protein